MERNKQKQRITHIYAIGVDDYLLKFCWLFCDRIKAKLKSFKYLYRHKWVIRQRQFTILKETGTHWAMETIITSTIKQHTIKTIETNNMARMTVIYQTPEDKEFFERHYVEVHIPLAKQLPGLLKYEISEAAIISPTGHSLYRIANLYFDSMEAIKNVFASEVGQKCAADRKILAPNNEDVQIYHHCILICFCYE